MRFSLAACFIAASLSQASAESRLMNSSSWAQSANMTPIPQAGRPMRMLAASCKSAGEKCSGARDTSCCSGLVCHSGGSGQGWICF